MADNKFLTLEGLTYYHGKLKTLVATKSELEQVKQTITSGLSWIAPVANLAALKAITTPKEGLTTSLEDTNQIYRFDAGMSLDSDKPDNTMVKPNDGTPGAWVLLGTTVYSKATDSTDGLMGSDHVQALTKATSDIAAINAKFEGESAKSAVKLANARNFSVTGLVTADPVAFDGTGDVALNVTSITIDNVDASKITQGTLSVDRLPKEALTTLKEVSSDEERLALTTSDVQNGDTVKVTGTNKMYFVVDDSRLNEEAGYSEYKLEVKWDEITSKPGEFTPAAHQQASDTINVMTGYSKAAATEAISASDSLNTAIGKLERALDDKANAADITTISNQEIDELFA